MRGNRGARGITDRAGQIQGQNYVGDPSGIVKPWGGGPVGVSSPAIGEYPTFAIPIDENDDGTDTMSRIDATSHADRTSTKDTTKARFRTQLKTIANWFAWFMDLATGTRSFTGLVVDGTGGVPVSSDPGNISASGVVKVAGSAGGAAAPTPTFVRGTFYKESAPFAICVCDGTNFESGLNIASFTKTGTGQYTIVLNTPASSTARMAIIGSANGAILVTAASNTSTIFVSTYQFSSSGPTIGLGNEAWSLVVYHT